MQTVVFLNDAPGPRAFWARRQCHETTIHSVDALAAALGRYPTSADTAIDPAVAVDGIDELLAGFMTRNKSRLRSESPMVVGVVAEESPTGWLVESARRRPSSRWSRATRSPTAATYASRVRPWRST